MSNQEREEGDSVDNFFTFEGFSRDNLLSALWNEKCLRLPTDHAIAYMHNYLDHLNCTQMVIENQYVDRNFLDDHSNYYVKCFQEYPRFCKRIHFFTHLVEGDIRAYLGGVSDTDELAEKLNKNYLGYMVARPLPKAIIGRTVLRPWEETVTSGDDEPQRRSIRSVREHAVNLSGLDLHVEGLGFQEQDRALAACATSALWVAFQRTAELFSHPRPTLYEITSHATQYFQTSRSIPSEGLSTSQVCQAIRAVGLEVDLQEIYDLEMEDEWCYKHPFLSACYAYLRAGIPVILAALVKGEGEHAVTLVGYRIGEKGSGVDEMELWCRGSGMSLRGSRVVSLYAHDDQIGPYSRLTVQPGEEVMGMRAYPLELGSAWRTFAGDPTTFVPLSIVVPLHYEIRVPFMSVLLIATRMELLLRRALGGVEWDISLSTVNEYKREVSRRLEMNPEVRQDILCMPLPRFLWRTRAFANGSEVCEMLVDATDMELSFQLLALNIFDEKLKDMLSDIPDFIRDVVEDDPLNIGRPLLKFVAEHVQPQV